MGHGSIPSMLWSLDIAKMKAEIGHNILPKCVPVNTTLQIQYTRFDLWLTTTRGSLVWDPGSLVLPLLSSKSPKPCQSVSIGVFKLPPDEFERVCV